MTTRLPLVDTGSSFSAWLTKLDFMCRRLTWDAVWMQNLFLEVWPESLHF